MPTYKLTIEYEGTRYSGWQEQGNTPKTVQGHLQRAAAAMLTALITALSAVNVTVVVVDADQRALLPELMVFSSLDLALKWSEDALLADPRI